MMPLFWLHWLHAPSLVSIGQSKVKLLSGNWISIFSNIDLDLNHRHLVSNPKMRLGVSYPYSKIGVNMPKQTKVIEPKLNFYFSNSDLDHRHLGSNSKLPLDISFLYCNSKFGVNRPKQTKVIERKPKVDTRLQHYNNPVFVENLVKKWPCTVINEHDWQLWNYQLVLNKTNENTWTKHDSLRKVVSVT